MPTLAFPTLTSRGPAQIAWSLVSPVLTHTSALSGVTRTLATPGSRWRFNAIWPNLGGDDRLAVECFLASLNGQAGRFAFAHPYSARPRGTVTSALTSGTATAMASTLAVVAAPGAVFEAGDFFGLPNAQLHRVTARAVCNGAGNATLAIAPPLRAAPPAGTALTLFAPAATFMLAGNDNGLAVGPAGLADWTLDAIEALA